MLSWLSENREWIFSGIGVFVVAAAVSIVRAAFVHRRRAVPKVGIKRESVTIAGEMLFDPMGKVLEREVFYPAPFQYTPHLVFAFRSGQFDNIEALEQRPDGFRLRVGGSGYWFPHEGLVVGWQAEGFQQRDVQH